MGSLCSRTVIANIFKHMHPSKRVVYNMGGSNTGISFGKDHGDLYFSSWPFVIKGRISIYAKFKENLFARTYCDIHI